MLKIYLIRHFMTPGNKLKRYIGVTDEPLSEEGRALALARAYPQAEQLYVSPLLRCRQTAELIYPHQQPILVEGLRECDFGEFENKNYLELSGHPAYQAWIDSSGTLPFPGGESKEGFQKRSLEAFCTIVDSAIAENRASLAIIAHGGTIMSIMEALAIPAKSYYEWHVENGGGYEVELDENLWKEGKRELLPQNQFNDVKSNSAR